MSVATNIIFSDKGLLSELNKHARIKSIKQGNVLMEAGADIVFVPIVEKGVLRIVRENDEGKEIFLYHLYPGQTCAMAINCCQSGKKSLVKAIAEEDTDVLLVPVNMVEEWFRFPEWKLFVNSTYSSRFAELLEVIDLIAFKNMDAQLQHYLQQRAKAQGGDTLTITHQQIADELHTHREAVSRLLRTMETQGLVELGRNSIRLIFH